MGNNSSSQSNQNSPDSLNMNKDVEITGDINVYVCGNINTFLNCKDGFNYTASRNYYVLEQIFEKIYKEKNGNIQFKNRQDFYYQYEARKKEKDNKQYNAFLFFNKADEEFLDNLFEHFYEIDRHNKNKNVLLYFGNEDEIIKSYDKLYSKSEETTPILLIVKQHSEYSDSLTYINYIPDLDTIKSIYRDDERKFSEDELASLSEKTLVNYINTKLFRIDMYYNQLGYNLNMINPMNETYLKIVINATIALVGYSGCGKSTLINLAFKQLVAKTSTSSTDVTTKCSEYYLPLKDNENDDYLGQLRFLDFPGITEDDNYTQIVEPEIKSKMKEFKENMEQIDVALFFISNGVSREFTKSGLKLVELLHTNNIKIIFVINGDMKPFVFKTKKEKLRNTFKETNISNILYEDLSNFIHTDFYQHFKESSKTGISKIFEKVIEEIKIKDKTFNVEDININNYNEKLLQLSKCNKIFESYDSMNEIKKKSKLKADLAVTGYCFLTAGSSALSLIIPVVDCALTIGYQVAMVYSVLSIYGLKPKDYDIVKIILTGGESIILKNPHKIIKKKTKEDENDVEKEEKEKEDEKDKIAEPEKNEENNNDVMKGNVREALKDVSNAAVYAGRVGIQGAAVKEAGKVIVEKTVQTVVTDTIEVAAIKTTTNTIEAVVVNAVEKTVSNTVEKIAIETTKELAEQGLKEGSKIMVNVAKDAVIGAVVEGGEEIIVAGTKESVKTITETIIVQQGGKAWLINLGKAVPFIGAAVSAVMNTYSTAKLGKKMVDKFNEEFDDNQQRKVDLLKGRIYGLLNIIEQIKSIIQDENKETKF